MVCAVIAALTKNWLSPKDLVEYDRKIRFLGIVQKTPNSNDLNKIDAHFSLINKGL